MKPRSGSGSVPDTKSSFPPPPVHLLNSDKRCSVGSRLPPINPLQKAKELGSPNFSLERSQSSGTLPLPLALLKKNPSLEKSIGSPGTPVAGVVASSFEEYYTETHGSKEEIDKKRIANVCISFCYRSFFYFFFFFAFSPLNSLFIFYRT